MIDNSELERILEILESLEDENLSRDLLKEFNDATARLGKLVLNLDESLAHEKWKEQCDLAQASLDRIVQKIHSLE